MTRHPAARRLHQQSSSDDQLTERLLQGFVWIKKNLRLVITGGTVLLIVVLATIYSVNMRQARLAEAALRLNEVRQTALSGNNALAIRDLETFISRFSGTTSAEEARLLMAQISLEEGEPEGAIEVLIPLARKAGTHLGTPAAFLLAAAYDQNGDVAAAERTYLQIVEEAPLGYQRREALEQAARIRVDKGDAASAVELYQRLVQMTQENSPERSFAEMRLAEVSARAAAS
jgi:predicted negative regulator of RcsB-dependent stress response